MAQAVPASSRLRLSERELWDAYSGTPAAVPLVAPCACGEPIVCASDDIPLGVRAHQAGVAHQTWRLNGGLEGPSFYVRVVGEPPMA